QYMDCVNPAKMRVRVLRDATASIPDLRARIQSLEAEAAATKEATRNQCEDDFAQRIATFSDAILERFQELQAAVSAGTACEWLGLLEGRLFWRFDDERMRDLQACYDDSRETSPSEGETEE